MDGFVNNFIERVETFQSHIRYYIVEGRPETIWDGYTETNPIDMWKGPISRFAAMYEPTTGIIHTEENPPVSGVSPGQIMFLYLSIDNFIHRSSAFQISEINCDKHRIVFNYLKQNATIGRQEITLFPIDSGNDVMTLIHHRAWFRGASKFIDRVFYPPYHIRVIDEFHKQIASIKGLQWVTTTCRKLKKKGLSLPDNPCNEP